MSKSIIRSLVQFWTLFLLLTAIGYCQNTAVSGWCELGNQAAVTNGAASIGTRPMGSSPPVPLVRGGGLMASYPQCLVTVFPAGSATPVPNGNIFSTAGGAILGNPFTANTDGSWVFYAQSACYDVVISAGATSASKMPATKTLFGKCGGVGTGGGGGNPGGFTGQIQGNNSGAFGGVPNTVVNFATGATELDITPSTGTPGNSFVVRDLETAGNPAVVQVQRQSPGAGAVNIGTLGYPVNIPTPLTVGSPTGVSAILFNGPDPFGLCNYRGLDQLSDVIDPATGSSTLAFNPSAFPLCAPNQRPYMTAFQPVAYGQGNIFAYDAGTGLPITVQGTTINPLTGTIVTHGFPICIFASTMCADAYTAFGIVYTTGTTAPTVDQTLAFNNMISTMCPAIGSGSGCRINIPPSSHVMIHGTAGAQSGIPISRNGVKFVCLGGPGPGYNAIAQTSRDPASCTIETDQPGMFLFGPGTFGDNETAPSAGPQFENITFYDLTANHNAGGAIYNADTNGTSVINASLIGGFRQTAVTPPSAPTCSVSNTGGTITGGAAQVELTYVTTSGDSLPSSPTTCPGSPISGANTGSASITIPAVSAPIIGVNAWCAFAGSSTFVYCTPSPSYTTNADGSLTIKFQTATPLSVTANPTSTRTPPTVDLSHSGGVAFAGSLGTNGLLGFSNQDRVVDLKAHIVQGAITVGPAVATTRIEDPEVSGCDASSTTGNCASGAGGVLTPGLIICYGTCQISNPHETGYPSTSLNTGSTITLTGFNNSVVSGTIQASNAIGGIGLSLVSAKRSFISGLDVQNYTTGVNADANSTNNYIAICDNGTNSTLYNDAGGPSNGNQWQPCGRKFVLAQSTTNGASINIPHGAAPSAPVDGDCWTTTAGFFCRINGSTVGPFGTGGGSSAFSSITSGTNTTAAMLVGTGGSLGVTGSGTIAATSVPWTGNANGSGNLSISPGGTSIFNTTTALNQFFAFKNTTAAVVGTSQGSPILSLCGRAFHGSADVEDCMTLGELPGNGNDAAITFTVGHTGTSTGVVTTQFPGPAAAGANGTNAAQLVLAGNTTNSAITANAVSLLGPASASFTAYGLQLPSANPSGGQVLSCGTPSSSVSTCSWASSGSGAPGNFTYLAKSANYTTVSGDFSSASAAATIVDYTVSSATLVTHTLPNTVTAGGTHQVVKNDCASTWGMYVAPANSLTLDGDTTNTFLPPCAQITIWSNGTNWQSSLGQFRTSNVGGQLLPVAYGTGTLATNYGFGGVNVPYAVQFVLTQPQKVSKMSYAIQVGVASCVFDYAIYDVGLNLITHLTGGAGASCVTANNFTTAVNTVVTLAPGVYYAVGCTNTASGTLTFSNLALNLVMTNLQEHVTTGIIGKAASGCAAGVLSSPLGAITNDSGNSGIPTFWVSP